MQYNVRELNLLAQGGEADLYEIDENKVLRIDRKHSANPFETEKIVFPILEKHGILIPKVYEYVQVDDRQAEIMERINGETMLHYTMSHPLCVKREIKQFAKIHQQILAIREEKELYPIDKFIYHFGDQPMKVEKEIFDFVMQTLKELPKGASVCHGDFHPGNILIEKEQKYIIDWSGAHVGNPVSDIANTYLLMACVPRAPGQGGFQYKILKFAGRYTAKLYLREIHKLIEFDDEEFHKWLIVMSLFRVYHGLPSEQEERKKYLAEAYGSFCKRGQV